MNGELVDWDKAQVHVLTHTLHYGTGVFEGIRAYETEQGPAVFRLTEHIERLFRSAHIMGMEIPYTVDELVAATKATVASTGLPGCYVRPIAYYGYGEMGLNTLPCTVDVAIACWPWGAYLGDDAVEKGVRMKISSWTRHDHNTMPPASKTIGNYVNSSLAKVEALKAGYDEAIMLAPNGLVAECTGENIFAVRNGIILTPPLSAGALEGITQSSVMTIATRPRLRHPGRQPRPQRPVHRRGDLRVRHRRRDQLGQLGRRPRGAVPRPDDQGHRRGLRPRRARPGGRVQGLVRTRRLNDAESRRRAATLGQTEKRPVRRAEPEAERATQGVSGREPSTIDRSPGVTLRSEQCHRPSELALWRAIRFVGASSPGRPVRLRRHGWLARPGCPARPPRPADVVAPVARCAFRSTSPSPSFPGCPVPTSPAANDPPPTPLPPRGPGWTLDRGHSPEGKHHSLEAVPRAPVGVRLPVRGLLCLRVSSRSRGIFRIPRVIHRSTRPSPEVSCFVHRPCTG